MNKLAFLALAALAPGFAGAVVIFDFNTPISGQPPVNGNQLLARLTISNAGSNTVNMTFQHFANPDSGRFFGALWLNVDPFKTVSLVGSPVAPISGVTSSLNGEGAPGMQYRWDVKVDFDQAPPSDRMHQGRTASWQLTGTGLVETDFLSFAGTTSGHTDQLYALVHVQGVTDTPGINSTWYAAVPEPGTMVALGAGLAALAARRRRAR